jgi:hypothetical protein
MWKNIHGDWSQIPAKRNNTKPTAWLRTPDSRLPPNADSARPHHKHHNSLVCTSCCQSRHRQKLISIFFASHEQRSRPVKRDGHWLLCQAGSVRVSNQSVPRGKAAPTWRSLLTSIYFWDPFSHISWCGIIANKISADIWTWPHHEVFLPLVKNTALTGENFAVSFACLPRFCWVTHEHNSASVSAQLLRDTTRTYR